MSVSVFKITRHAVQVLVKRVREKGETVAILRLYDEDNVNRGTVVFEAHGDRAPPKPTGDFDAGTGTAHLDLALFRSYMEVLRQEKTIYLKLGWAQAGKLTALSQFSIDTKKEVLGEYFQP